MTADFGKLGPQPNPRTNSGGPLWAHGHNGPTNFAEERVCFLYGIEFIHTLCFFYLTTFLYIYC